MTRCRVLVAEDDCDFRDYIVEELRRNGYEVIPIEDGRHLVEHLATAMLTRFRMPQVVVADIRMPGPTGLEVTAALARTSSIPIILITAFGDARTHELAASAGAVALLDKPFAMRELLALLEHTVENDLASD
jgi:CheY-like chemotaxis protein